MLVLPEHVVIKSIHTGQDDSTRASTVSTSIHAGEDEQLAVGKNR